MKPNAVLKPTTCWQRLLQAFCRHGNTASRQPRIYRIPRLEWLEERLAPSHNTLNTALPLSFSDRPVVQVAETLTTPTQVDFYAVTLHAGDRLTAAVDAQQQGSLLIAAVQLFNAGGTSLARKAGSSGHDPLLTYVATASSTYLVGVSSAGGSTTGIYALTVTDLAARFVTAAALSGTGQMLTRTLGANGRTDYRLTAQQTEFFAASVGPTSGSPLQPRLALYDATGQLLIQSDRQRPGVPGAELEQHLQVGTYYLEVSPAATSPGPAAGQGYRLTYRFASSAPPLSGTFPAGSPFLVEVADVNGDGIPDLVTADHGYNTVSVLLGNGDGSFQTARSFPTGLVGFFDAYSLVVADVNGDGKPDLVLAGYSGDKSVSVLLGNGDGTFQTPMVYPVGIGQAKRFEFADVSVAVADVNGDGRLDLVAATADDNTVSVLLGNGDGTFQPARTFTGGGNSVAVADVNRDGRPDIVTASEVTGTVNVLLGNGDGTFQTARSFAVGGGFRHFGEGDPSVAVADFNGDGKPDLVVANFYPASVDVLLGNGDGTFQTARSTPVDLDINSLYSLVVADLNGDGRPDIVTANLNNDSVSVLLGNGDGSFQQTNNLAVEHGAVFFAAVADVNSDGRPDIVTANQDGTMSVLLGNGDGSFQDASSHAVGNGPSSVAVADLNGDGRPDIVTANYTGVSVSVLLGNGDGSFQTAHSFTVYQPNFVAVADLNGDGRPDLVSANSTAVTVSVLLGNGDGSFQQPRTFAVGFGGIVAVADVNGDGRPDLVTSKSVLLGNGDGSFQHPRPFAVGSGGIVAVADVNGDGIPDLVTQSTRTIKGVMTTYTVSVLLGNGDGSFQPAHVATGGFSRFVAVADINGDGRPDLVIESGNTVSVLLGNGDGSFQPARTFATRIYGVLTSVADVNGDGRADIIETYGFYGYNGTVSVLLGNGDGSFQQPRTFAVGSYPVSVAVADLNGDGRPDLVTANKGDNTVSVLLNQGLGQFQSPQGPTNVPRQDIPLLQDLTGDRVPDALSLNDTGELLFRQGAGNPNEPFAPFVVVNPDHPARDFTLVQTAGLPEVAALDDNAVSLYAWSSTDQQFDFIGSVATGQHPVRIASTDLNGDGLGDLVVANEGDHSLTIAFQFLAGGLFDTDTITRYVGADPSNISFADVNGDGRPDIVVSDQVAGDVAVLFNDPGHPFLTQARYRAGRGPFDVDPGLTGTTVVSNLQTIGAVAADFAGEGNTDLVALNANTDSFTLLRGAGAGSFADPQVADTYHAAPGALQVLAGDFLHDGKQDLAILTVAADGTSQVWVYPNIGSGIFAVPIESDAGQGATGFSFVPSSNGSPDHFLVGNAYGDFLTLAADVTRPVDFSIETVNRTQPGHYHIERGTLNGKPLAVGKTPDGRQFVVVADQGQDQVQVYFRKPGTDQFEAPVLIPGNTATLLAPGAVQLIDLNPKGLPDLVVASRLGNDILVYPGLADGSFGSPTSFPVGFEPVAFTAADLNGDGVLDLAVANQGSNDVSILDGAIDPTTGLWTATAGPRLKSGGSEPLAVTAGDFNGDGIPDLRVTNAGGQVATLPGIGSSDQGTGFFNDTNPTTADLGATIIQAVFDPVSGAEFVVRGDGGISLFDGQGFTPVFDDPSLRVTVLGEEDGLLVAAFADGGVGVLESDDHGLFHLGQEVDGYADTSALEVLRGEQGLEVYLTLKGQAAPVILSFDLLPVVTELPSAVTIAQASSLPEADVALLATLVMAPPGEQGGGSAGPASPGDEVFAAFNPSLLTPPRGRVADGGGDNAAPPVVVPDADDVLPRDLYRSGFENSWQRWQQRHQADLQQEAPPAPPGRPPQPVEPIPAGPEVPEEEVWWRKDMPDHLTAPPPDVEVFAVPELLRFRAIPSVPHETVKPHLGEVLALAATLLVPRCTRREER